MSIINNIVISEKPVFDEEKYLDNLMRELKMQTEMTARRLAEICVKTWEDVWENDRVTPQKVLQKMGANAASFFLYHSLLIELSGKISEITLPEKVKSAKLPYTVHKDGTITINNQ